MKNLFSYIWPITRKIPSEFNGVLEVTYSQGKKVLDSKSANYSYGPLQEILEFGLTKVDLKSVDNLLLLGLGGGSIIKSLRETFEYKNQIYAVDIDAAIIQIAKEEFGISESWNLKIIHDDAFLFTKTSRRKYQLIIIDLFIDNKVPSIFYQKEFCDRITRILSPQGSFIFNVGMNPENDNEAAENLVTYFEENFVLQLYPNVLKQNFLIIGTKKEH